MAFILKCSTFVDIQGTGNGIKVHLRLLPAHTTANRPHSIDQPGRVADSVFHWPGRPARNPVAWLYNCSLCLASWLKLPFPVRHRFWGVPLVHVRCAG